MQWPSEMPAYKLKGYVEIDEMFIGASTEGKKRGRGTEKTPVLVAVSYTPVKERKKSQGLQNYKQSMI